MEQYVKDSSTDRSPVSYNFPLLSIPKHGGSGAWTIAPRMDTNNASNDVSLFSSSLPVLPHEKSSLANLENQGQCVDDGLPNLSKTNLENEGNDCLENVEPNAIGSLLPDDEDVLLAGIGDDFDLSGLPSQLEDLEDYDLFGSGGGLELDFEPQESLKMGMSKLNFYDGVSTNVVGHCTLSNGVGTLAGEHPYGEHPSRTLFVRNINSNVEDSELRSLFEQYGDIRTLYTACKHRGFVMISYYDIRAARIAMRALQNKPLRRRKLDIHFSIPKDNPSEKDINQGTLVVFNLDPSVSNDDLRHIFGAYGEVKEIRETPHKRHHKFIEFYDVRAAEAALKALNRSDIGGKRIKLEPSRPGGARRNWIQQLSQELEQDDTRSLRHHLGSPLANSPPGNWTQLGSPVEHNLLHGFSKSPGLGTSHPINNNHLPGLASIIPPHLSNSAKIAPIGKEQGRVSLANKIASLQGRAYQHSRSFPEQKLSASPGKIFPFNESGSNSASVGTLSGPQFLWGSPTTYSERSGTSAWPTSSTGHPFSSNGQGDGFTYTSQRGSFIGSHHYHHVGSAPSGVSLDRHLGFFPDSPETSFMNPVAYGGMGLTRNKASYMMNTGGRVGVSVPGNVTENGSPSFGMMSLPRHGSMFLGNGLYPAYGGTNNDLFSERGHSRRGESNVSLIDCKKQYQLDLDKITSGEDSRTTLMIKNIPNKYTSNMLLAAIDANHRGTYDFLYLPIDFKAFNGKKWEKFNSEKVASLAYARIQGKVALLAHFQNSSLMNEDKWCRPILFQLEGQETADQEFFLSGNLNIFIRQPDGSYSGDSLESSKDNMDEKPEKI